MVVLSRMAVALFFFSAVLGNGIKVVSAEDQFPWVSLTATCVLSPDSNSESTTSHFDLQFIAKHQQVSRSEGLFLYVADLTDGKGYYWVGYNSGSDQFDALIHDRINSIAGQGTIEFQEGHEISFMLRKGAQSEHQEASIERLPQTDYISQVGLILECPGYQSGNE